MKRTSLLILMVSGLLSFGSTWAGEGGDTQPSMGQETRAWMELQRSGSAASDTERPLAGEVARRSYQRYVETHSYKIPESFADEEQSFIRK